MSAFLKIASGKRSGEAAPYQAMDGWVLSPSFTDTDAYATFYSLLKLDRSGNRRPWKQGMGSEDDEFAGYFPFTAKADGWGLDLGISE